MPGEKTTTKSVGRRYAEIALNRRSPLYQWMHAHYRELLPRLSLPRPSWTALAETAAEAGQLTAGGELHSRQTMAQTWRSLQRDMESKPAQPVLPPPPVHPPATRHPAPPQTASEDDKPAATPPARKRMVLPIATPIKT